MSRNRILIIEDEQRLADILRIQLEESGFDVELAYEGLTGKKKLLENEYDLIILDILLPYIDGYELCREIRRKNSKTPVIMLTALGTQENKLSGFETGADDYVLKPFDFRELLARIHVFLKRTQQADGQPEKLQISDLTVDVNSKTVIRGNKKINLTSREFALLEIFIRNKGKLLTREFLIEKVWGIDFDTNTNILDVYINYLRNKIDAGSEIKLIHNKFGFGYYCNDKEI
jgi:two-component system, OmpR family, copper resistance phosphate regulon response regulator CusR